MDCEVPPLVSVAVFWTVIGTGVAVTTVVLTVLLTAMTMHARALHARFDEQNKHLDEWMASHPMP